ncbi:MAG: tetratricopeptide repeat protein [Muribaculaceae bacterium]|nr:tetratricopeptide repeat protein [Muribaculaceae bacterium]
MKLKALIFAILGGTLCSVAAPQSPDVTAEVMKVYDQMMRENYKDYETLFRRANAYYNTGDYLKALDDLDRAVKYCPSTDTESLFAIHALRGECYYCLKRYAMALPELTKALSYEPTSTSLLELRGLTAYELGKYDDAKDDFTKIQRIQPRSQEALFGLALVAAKQSNIGLATDYMDQAVAITPNRSGVFVQRAEVKKLIGDYNGAVDDLLLAMATDGNDPEALPALVRLADSNYSAVVAGLTGAIRRAPRNPLFYYLRASIAAAHFHYQAAIADFKYIIDNNLYDYSGLFCSLAECYYALGQFEKALDNSEQALASADMQADDLCHYSTVRALIQRAMGQNDKALASIDRALDYNENDIDAQVARALILIDKKEYDKASAQLGELTMTNPFEPMPYLLRAWIANDFTKQPDAAKGFYQRVIDLELDHSELVGSYLGFAQLFTGQTPKAVSWMDAILAEPDYDGKNHYFGACFYAWAGRPDKALECVEAALRAGYANLYDWKYRSDARINVAPLRDDARFQALLTQYQSIF